MEQHTCTRCGATLEADSKFCPNCGTSVQQPTSTKMPSAAAKIRKPLSKTAKMIYTGGAIIIFALLFYTFSHYLPGGPNPIIAKQPEVAMASPYFEKKLTPVTLRDDEIHIKNGIISFDFNALRNSKFIEFTYHNTTADETIIAYISPAGKMVTCIGLCEPCGTNKFTTDETEIVSSCGTRWKMDNLEFSGGCGVCQKFPPDPIPSTVEGNDVRIDESIVKNWKRRAS